MEYQGQDIYMYFHNIKKIIYTYNTGLPAPSQLKKRDLGNLFNKKRDLKRPIFHQNKDQFEKRDHSL